VESLTAEGFGKLIDSCTMVLGRAAHEDWPIETLEAFLQKVRHTSYRR
jgi:hypothetical protein